MEVLKRFKKVFTLWHALVAVALMGSITFVEAQDSLGFDPSMQPTQEEYQDAMMRLMQEIPEEKLKQLEKQAQMLEQRMKEADVNTEDFEAVMDWLGKQDVSLLFDENDEAEPTPVKPASEASPKSAAIAISPIVPDRKAARPEIGDLLLAVLKRIEYIRDEAIQEDDAADLIDPWNGDLDQVVYFLHRLYEDKKSQELLELPENETLYKALSHLNEALAPSEELIRSLPVQKSRGDVEADVFDPYTRLGVTYTATQDEIERVFNELAAAYSPEALEKRHAHLSKKSRRRRIARDRTSFSRIRDAYELLSDPKQRTQLVDRKLRTEIRHEQLRKQQFYTAIATAVAAFEHAFTLDKLLESIKAVFQQLAPHELELAQKHEAEQREIRIRAQKKRRMAPSARPHSSQGDEYDDFYRQLEIQEWQRRAASMSHRPSSSPSTTSSRKGRRHKEDAGAGKKPGDKKPGGQKPSDKKKKSEDSKGKKADKKEDKSKKDLAEKPKNGISEAEQELLKLQFENVGKATKKMASQKLTVTTPAVDATSEPTVVELTLDKAQPVIDAAKKYLKSPTTRSQKKPDAVKTLDAYMKEADLKDMYKAVNAFEQKISKGKIKDDKLAKAWKELMTEKGAAQQIVQLKKRFHDDLLIAGIPSGKQELHGLKHSPAEIKKLGIKDPEKGIKATAENLGLLRFYAYGIYQAAESISQKLLGLRPGKKQSVLERLVVPPKKK